MANPWFKFYGPEYLSDTKLLGMDGNTRSCWLTLLCYASLENGKVPYLDEDQLMIQAGVPVGGEEWKKTTGVLKRFQERGMVEITEGYIEVMNWEKRQESYLTPYERVKRHREKSKDDVINDNAMITIDKNREDKKDKKDVAVAPITPVFERKIREKDDEYRALVKDLAANDYLSGSKIHQILLEEFLPHWLERSEGAKKARWEKERAFDYQRRVRTWITNFHKWAKDERCKSGMWHRKGDSCHCVKEEVIDRSKPLVPSAIEAVRAMAREKTVL